MLLFFLLIFKKGSIVGSTQTQINLISKDELLSHKKFVYSNSTVDIIDMLMNYGQSAV